MESKISYEDLGYLTTHEMWVLMRDLKIPYCNVVDEEKENLATKEKVIVPKFIPRTDYDDMKSDIIVALNKLNRQQKREIEKRISKTISKRKTAFLAGAAKQKDEEEKEGDISG